MHYVILIRRGGQENNNFVRIDRSPISWILEVAGKYLNLPQHYRTARSDPVQSDTVNVNWNFRISFVTYVRTYGER